MKTIKIASVILFSILAFTANAQVGKGYKNQFPVSTTKYATASNVASNQFVNSYNEAHNYKQHVYKISTVTTVEATLACCTSHTVGSQFTNANYKQPHSKPLHQSCGTGLECNDKVKLDCCKI